MTLRELGELVGLHESTVQRYEKGKIKKIDMEVIKEFARALRVNPVYILGWEGTEEFTNSVLVPVYGNIPAGVPIEAVEDIQGYEDIPVEWLKGDKRYIALKVRGDSMYPKYLDGDTVIILLQPDCENGQDCACYVNGFDTTLKTVFKYNSKIELKPLNPNYPPKTYDHPGDVVIIGTVKELRRRV